MADQHDAPPDATCKPTLIDDSSLVASRWLGTTSGRSRNGVRCKLFEPVSQTSLTSWPASRQSPRLTLHQPIQGGGGGSYTEAFQILDLFALRELKAANFFFEQLLDPMFRHKNRRDRG